MEIIFCLLVILFIIIFFVIFLNIGVKWESTEEIAFQNLIELVNREKTKAQKKKHSRNKYKKHFTRWFLYEIILL